MTSGHQTWQLGELKWEATTTKVKSPFDHVVTWDLVTNKKMIYLQLHKAYYNQTWQGGDLSNELPPSVSCDTLTTEK